MWQAKTDCCRLFWKTRKCVVVALETVVGPCCLPWAQKTFRTLCDLIMTNGGPLNLFFSFIAIISFYYLKKKKFWKLIV